MIQEFSRASARVLLAAASIAFAGAAEAQSTRTFYCGDGAGSIVVTVLSQQQIRAVVDLDSEDGKFTMKMQQRGSGYHFVKGEYEITITNVQDSLTYSAPDYGTIGCTWSGG